ncbi:gliding motility-associated C-terminal domain-containing protein [Maribacter sp. R86514]|uniref:gliding motility-associated C-terminal domain-containing protein n=1 Tax=Maribacter sp. R86514 TaxID=3093854 RepID=UPI0037C6E717
MFRGEKSFCYNFSIIFDLSYDVEYVADGDGVNDSFLIQNIESYPNNTVEVYNRWGVSVYKMSGYDNVSNLFKGLSDGRATIDKDSKLPVGVYFYVIKYNNNGDNLNKSGYLYINR